MIARGAPLIGAIGRLRPGARDARGCVGRDARPRARHAGRDAAHRDQSALGAEADARCAAQPAARAARRARLERSRAIADEDVAMCRGHRRARLEDPPRGWRRRSTAQTLNILTHCNAGWLATVDWGTALAPIYMAHDAGIPICMSGWTRRGRATRAPRSPPSNSARHGVPHTIIADNAGGHYMQAGQVDW